MCGHFYLTLSLFLSKVSPARAKWHRSGHQLPQPGCAAGLDWTASVGLKKKKTVCQKLELFLFCLDCFVY